MLWKSEGSGDHVFCCSPQLLNECYGDCSPIETIAHEWAASDNLLFADNPGLNDEKRFAATNQTVELPAASQLGSKSHGPLEAAQEKISCAREHSRSCRLIW